MVVSSLLHLFGHSSGRTNLSGPFKKGALEGSSFLHLSTILTAILPKLPSHYPTAVVEVVESTAEKVSYSQ